MEGKYPHWYTLLENGEYQYIDGSIENEIERVKDKLASTDYQILKMMECQATGEALRYSTSIYSERKALRDEIAVLEGLLTP